MERILRGVMQIGGQPEEEDALSNWNRFVEHDLEFETEEDLKLFEYFKTYYGQMSSPPDFKLVKEYFEKSDDIETVTRLEEVAAAPVYIRTNYLSIVRSEQDRQQVRGLVLLCRDAGAIAEQGRNVDGPKGSKKVLRGVNDAVNYVFENLGRFTRVESGSKLEGVVSDDAEEVIDEYEHIERTDQYANRNLFGLEPVDSVCRGHKRGEFWVHTAFTGELKSTLALNYAYNNVMVYGKNIFYAILEMPYDQLRRQLYAIHSSHGKFVTEWYDEDGYTGLDYRAIRDGELDARGKERLRIVARDFKESAKGKLYVWRPPGDVLVSDIQRKAEMFHNRWSCDGVIVDHLGLVKLGAQRDYVVALNQIVRDARVMALNFARGRGVPVLALFQMNRQGKLRAEKNDGRYDIAAISYANEIEKSADVITYTYLDDALRAAGKFYMGNLKNRDNPLFERMIGKILWQSKRVRAIESGLLDMNNDQVLDASRQIARGLDMVDLLAS